MTRLTRKFPFFKFFGGFDCLFLVCGFCGSLFLDPDVHHVLSDDVVFDELDDNDANVDENDLVVVVIVVIVMVIHSSCLLTVLLRVWSRS